MSQTIGTRTYTVFGTRVTFATAQSACDQLGGARLASVSDWGDISGLIVAGEARVLWDSLSQSMFGFGSYGDKPWVSYGWACVRGRGWKRAVGRGCGGRGCSVAVERAARHRISEGKARVTVNWRWAPRFQAWTWPHTGMTRIGERVHTAGAVTCAWTVVQPCPRACTTHAETFVRRAPGGAMSLGVQEV